MRSLKKQEEWIKTQLRILPKQHHQITEYANNNQISFNSAVVELAAVGLEVLEHGRPDTDVKVIHLKNGKKRLVFGKFMRRFDIDYENEDLSELKEDLESCLAIMSNSKKLGDKIRFFNKDILVHQGANHLDIVDDGVGSLNWLVIEDHY